MELLQHLRKNPFVLAPMAGITDHPFRSFMRKRGAGVVVTELISATGCLYKNEKTLSLMSFSESQRPIGIQLFGEDPLVMAEAAKIAEDRGCDFIDLNFGCPVPKVTKKGAGSAVLREPERLAAILRAVKSAIKIPLTIKIRTGWDANSRNAHEVCRIAWGEGVTWVTIHGRTRAQNYSGLADWDYIAEVKARASIPIIGNGDILTAKQAVSLLASTGCDAVMIGRGALKNPYIFEEAYRLWAGDPQLNSEKNLKQVFLELNKELEQHCDERILSIQLKKFGSWFSSGYPGAASYRKKLFQTQSIKEIIEISVEFFSNVTIDQQQDTSGEAFLMGGHG